MPIGKFQWEWGVQSLGSFELGVHSAERVIGRLADVLRLGPALNRTIAALRRIGGSVRGVNLGVCKPPKAGYIPRH
jgi:hypothetical protein